MGYQRCREYLYHAVVDWLQPGLADTAVAAARVI